MIKSGRINNYRRKRFKGAIVDENPEKFGFPNFSSDEYWNHSKLNFIENKEFYPDKFITELFKLYEASRIHFAKKLEIIDQVDLNGKLFQRLVSNSDSRLILLEIDIIVKLIVGKIHTKLIRETSDPRPDLFIQINNAKYNFEITSMNPHIWDIKANEFSNQINHIGFMNKVNINGIICHFPHKGEEEKRKEVIKNIENATKEVIDKQTCISIIEPGMINIHISPRELESCINSTHDNSFSFIWKEKKPFLERLRNTILKKQNQLNYNNLTYRL